jgi:type IV secretion system protein VirD4
MTMVSLKHRITLIGGSLLSAVVVPWAATEWIASDLHYQSALGTPVIRAFKIRLYPPWEGVVWWLRYRLYAPRIFDRVIWIAPTTFVPLLLIGSMLPWRSREQAVSTFGSSRWAVRRDIRSAGLFENGGVVLGLWNGRYLRHDGPDHVLLFAPTRSGKGVGLVVPTLLSWTGSVIVHDIKGENWSLTAGWRSRFSRCLRCDPTDGSSARYNPLLEVRKGTREVADVQNIADILIDPEGMLERRNHWEQASHALLVGAMLHVLYVGTDSTLSSVARLLSDPDRSFSATLEAMLTANHLGSADAPRTHPVVAAAARDLLNKSDAERSGILSTTVGFLSLYRDPVVAELTSRSDWRIADLVGPACPLSLYLVIPPSDLSRTRPFVRLILNQIARRLTEVLPDQSSAGRKLLLLLDEFPALGRLDFFETSLAFLAGYNVRAFLVAQSLNQITKAYGENSSILDNCRVRVAFSTNDERTAKRLSDALGTATHQRAMRSYGGNRMAAWLPHVTESSQETARPLLTPGEIMQLPANEALLIVSGCPPIRAQKLRYHEDRNFRVRLLPPPERQFDERVLSLEPQKREPTFASVAREMEPAEKPGRAASQLALLGLEETNTATMPVEGSVEPEVARTIRRQSRAS